MNRRTLIKSLGQGVIGAGAAVLGVKSAEPIEAPKVVTITIQASDKQIFEAVARNIRNNGKVRQVLREVE
jgi:hypothetical protein